MGNGQCFDSILMRLVILGPRQYQGGDETERGLHAWSAFSATFKFLDKGGGGMFTLSWLWIIVFSIFHYSGSTERARLKGEVGCSGIVWLTKVSNSQ